METNNHNKLVGRYTQPNWQFEKYYFELHQNGFGHYWPIMFTRNNQTNQHLYPIYIKDSDPFKTLKGAIKYVNVYIQNKYPNAYRENGNCN